MCVFVWSDWPVDKFERLFVFFKNLFNNKRKCSLYFCVDVFFIQIAHSFHQMSSPSKNISISFLIFQFVFRLPYNSMNLIIFGRFFYHCYWNCCRFWCAFFWVSFLFIFCIKFKWMSHTVYSVDSTLSHLDSNLSSSSKKNVFQYVKHSQHEFQCSAKSVLIHQRLENILHQHAREWVVTFEAILSFRPKENVKIIFFNWRWPLARVSLDSSRRKGQCSSHFDTRSNQQDFLLRILFNRLK